MTVFENIIRRNNRKLLHDIAIHIYSFAFTTSLLFFHWQPFHFLAVFRGFGVHGIEKDNNSTIIIIFERNLRIIGSTALFQKKNKYKILRNIRNKISKRRSVSESTKTASNNNAYPTPLISHLFWCLKFYLLAPLNSGNCNFKLFICVILTYPVYCSNISTSFAQLLISWYLFLAMKDEVNQGGPNEELFGLWLKILPPQWFSYFLPSNMITIKFNIALHKILLLF